MLEDTRRAMKEALRKERNPAVRQWARLMLKSGNADTEQRRRRRRKVGAK